VAFFFYEFREEYKIKVGQTQLNTPEMGSGRGNENTHRSSETVDVKIESIEDKTDPYIKKKTTTFFYAIKNTVCVPRLAHLYFSALKGCRLFRAILNIIASTTR
jgi:hypothetical protein